MAFDFAHAFVDFAKGKRVRERHVEVAPTKHPSPVFAKFPMPVHPEVSTNTQLKHKLNL